MVLASWPMVMSWTVQKMVVFRLGQGGEKFGRDIVDTVLHT
jgi:hypothetical protein